MVLGGKALDWRVCHICLAQRSVFAGNKLLFKLLHYGKKKKLLTSCNTPPRRYPGETPGGGGGLLAATPTASFKRLASQLGGRGNRQLACSWTIPWRERKRRKIKPISVFKVSYQESTTDWKNTPNETNLTSRLESLNTSLSVNLNVINRRLCRRRN